MTGLLGNTFHADTTDWVRKDSGIGAGIDSFYEYMLKVGTLHARPTCFMHVRSAVQAKRRGGRSMCCIFASSLHML